MKHLGDITKIDGRTVPKVSVIIGGSPCQDLSVAGKRSGLSGERSGLFMEMIRIIKEMREDDKRNGRTGVDVRPRFMVWENVPGAFSSNKGEDFRIVLEEIVKIIDKNTVIPRPPKDKWRNVGVIMGDGFSVAWRVLDAQFWGVPQRRRRIALVADFGGSAAPEILFERESLSGDSEPCEPTREETASDSYGCVGITNRGYVSGDVTESLRAESHGALPMVGIYLNSGASDATHPAICIQGNCIDRADTAGCNGKGWRDDDVSFTLNTIDRPAVYSIENHPADSRCNISDDGIVQTLSSRMGTGGGNVPMCMTMQSIGEYKESEVASSCKQRDYKDATDLICAVDCRNGTENPDTNGTLQAESDGGCASVHARCSVNSRTFRRLTPLECERLQGYPDGWTDIGEWTDTKGKVHKECADTARYKALGNSIALPPWRYVLSGVIKYCGDEKTMASLFDGIGGFPLIWQELGGDTLWASEIEEFPIAVTKKHF